MHSLMQAHPPASESASTVSGMPGLSALIGAMEAVTSTGPRALDLSSLSTQSSTLTLPTFISNYLETIRALSKPGTKDAAATDPPTMSSSMSSPLLQVSIALLTSATSLAQTTPLTPSHVAYIPPHISSSLSFPSLPSSNIFSSMLPARCPPNTSRPAKPCPIHIQTAIILDKALAPPAQSTQPYLTFPPSSQHHLSNHAHPSHSSPSWHHAQPTSNLHHPLSSLHSKRPPNPLVPNHHAHYIPDPLPGECTANIFHHQLHLEGLNERNIWLRFTCLPHVLQHQTNP